MTRTLIFWVIMFIFPILGKSAVTIPEPPDLSEIYALVIRPSGTCDGTEYYLEAESLLTQKGWGKYMKNGILDENSEPFKLMLNFIECEKFVLPDSMEINMPLYFLNIPVGNAFRHVVETFKAKGASSLKNRDFDAAYNWYSKAVNIGLHVWEEPGITFLQEWSSLRYISEGVEGLGDLFIAKGDSEKAAACARFLANKTAYLDQFVRFVNVTLNSPKEWPPEVTPEYREIAIRYPEIKHPPIKLEILEKVGYLNAYTDDSETKAICMKIIKESKKDPDFRIRKVANWAETWSKDKIFETYVRDDHFQHWMQRIEGGPKKVLLERIDKNGPFAGWWENLPHEEIIRQLRGKMGLLPENAEPVEGED